MSSFCQKSCLRVPANFAQSTVAGVLGKDSRAVSAARGGRVMVAMAQRQRLGPG